MKNKLEVLLVEDLPSDVRLTQEALKDSGLDYNLSLANDGEEALQFLRSTKLSKGVPRPDVILLDLNMPRKNGHEFLTEIKDDLDLARIPIILLTVSQQDRDILAALRLKMNYYLSKPVSSEKLAVILKAIFDLHEKEASIRPNLQNRREDTHVRLVLSSNPHTPTAVLSRLAKEENVRIRCGVAENPNTPPEILKALAQDDAAEVRLSVAENPNTPKLVLESLCQDKSDDVRLGLAENPNIPSDLLQSLAVDDNIFVASCAAKTLASSMASPG